MNDKAPAPVLLPILAIDPGGTTGLAYNVRDHIYTRAIPEQPERIWEFVGQGILWSAVICEKFTGAGHMNAIRVYTIELVGGIRSACQMAGIPFYYRTPQNRRAFMAEAKERLVMKGEKFVDHQTDALAHLLAWQYWGRFGLVPNGAVPEGTHVGETVSSH